MGHYFDVHGYPGTTSALDLSTGLSSVGDALTDVLNRRQKAQQFRDELQFQKEDAQRKFAQNQANDAYQNRIIAERERRDQRQEADRENDRRNTAVNAAMANIKAGHPEMARANIEGTRVWDPAMQSYVQGSFEQGPRGDVGMEEPQKPVLGPAPAPVPPEVAARRRGRTATSEAEDAGFYKSDGRPMPAAFGVDPTEPPVFTDDGKPPKPEYMAQGLSPEVQGARYQDTSDMIAEEQARMDAKQYEGAKSAFDAASAAYPAERAKYDAAVAQAEANRPYTIRFGANDPGVTVHPNELRTEGRHAAAEDFAASIRGLNLDPRGKANAAAALAAIEAGRDPKEVYRSFDRAQATGQKFEDQTALQTQKDIAAKERALIAGPRNPGDFHVGQLHEQQEAGTVRDLKVFEDQFKDWERQAAQLGTESKGYANLARAVKNAAAPGGIQQHEGMSALSRYFGGGVAREFEQKFLFQHLAGYGARAQSILQNIDNGQFGPDELAAINSAVRDALAESHGRAQELYESARTSFGPGTGHDYFGGNVDARVRGALKTLGYEAEPLYPGVAPVQLGDIVRPYRTQLHGRGQAPPPAPRAPGAPPEINAHNKAKSNAALDDAMAP